MFFLIWKRRPALVLWGTLAWAGLWACARQPLPSAESRPPVLEAPRPLKILALTDLQGFLEPCGCTNNQLGGLARLATLLAAERKTSSDSLLLDGGDRYFSAGKFSGRQLEDQLFKARTLDAALKKLGFDSGALGEMDLRLPTQRVVNLQRPGGPPFTVGLVGFVEPGFPSPEFLRAQGLTAQPAEVSLKAAVRMVREQGASVVILLAQAHVKNIRPLLKNVPGIDFVVRGHEARSYAVREENSWILEAGNQGQYLAVLELCPAPGAGRPDWVDLDDPNGTREERESLKTRVLAYQKEFELSGNAGATAATAEFQRAKIAELKQRLENLEKQSAPVAVGQPGFRFRLVPVEAGITEDPAIRRELDGYYTAMAERNRSDVAKSYAPVEKSAPVFSGASVCHGCHERERDFWAKTAHAAALATLQKRHRELDYACIGCHATGYELPGGFRGVAGAEIWGNVQCEACHGFGSLHSAQPDKAGFKLPREVPEDVCRKCHTPEHSPGFNYPSYLHKITGPGHGK